MPKAELFFPEDPIKRINTSVLPISIYMPAFSKNMSIADRGLDGWITADKIPDLLPVMFEDQHILWSTLTEIESGQTLPYTNLETVIQHQAGAQGLIRIFRAKTEDGRITPFVIHLSRFPTDNHLSEYLEKEFNDLRYLAGLFETHLSAETRARYNVVKPLQFGVTGEFNGKRYPFFTMPFIPMGELHLDWYPVGYGDVPFFRYALPYDDQMMKEIQHQLDTQRKQEGLDTHKKLSEDLLIANGLIYHLTGRRMLKKMIINAGDWMADLSDPLHGMPLTLISTHEGLTDPMSEEEWIATIKDHQEMFPALLGGKPIESPVYTFLNHPDSFYRSALDIAASLITSDV